MVTNDCGVDSGCDGDGVERNGVAESQHQDLSNTTKDMEVDDTAKENGNVANKCTTDKVCETPGCGKPAPLQCPKCLEMKLKPSNFCSQPCFKSYYSVHKQLHSIALKLAQKGEDLVLRYATFRQTGTLLPYKQTPYREVPRSIKRPDYADDVRGVPHSELSSKRSGQIAILNENEIAGNCFEFEVL